MKLIQYIFVFFVFSQIYTAEHNHNQKYDEQWRRMIRVGKIFDTYLENAEKGLKCNFTSVFSAMNILADGIVCPACQKEYRAILRYNQERVIDIQKKLASGQLPKHDDEPGHYL